VVLRLLQVLLHARPELHRLFVRDNSLDDLIHFGVAAIHHHHRIHVTRLHTHKYMYIHARNDDGRQLMQLQTIDAGIRLLPCSS